MNEESILAGLPRQHPNLILGPGDDAAIFRPKAAEDLVFTTDMFIDGVHFRNLAAKEVGRRALARALSDIAAMGADPRFCLASVAFPKSADKTWIAQFFVGLMLLASETSTAIAGGDLSHARHLVADITVCGAVPRGKALRRDTARPGDILYVSGPLGGWRNRTEIAPRLALGKQLRGKATACMDISDGLALDLHRLCKASAVSAVLDDIPLLPNASLKQALHDGEDYELLYTAPPKTRVPGLRIGALRKGRPGQILLDGAPINPTGYDHFSRTRP